MKNYGLPVGGILLVIAFFFFTACTKQGVLGPQGVPGEQGDTGPQGPAGSAILTGKGSPVAESGKTGDFYIDTANLMLYGPKSQAGWGTGISLASTVKASVLHGDGTPVATLGSDGDFYFDDEGGMLYGPKTDQQWGTGFLVHGATGPAGEQGATGPQGNANVKAYTFTSDLKWESFGNGVYQITKKTSVIDSLNLLQGALLAYVQLSDSFWYQAPFWFNDRNYYYNLSRGVFTLYSPNPGKTVIPEEVIEIKLIIMQGTSIEALDVARRTPFEHFLRVARALHQDG